MPERFTETMRAASEAGWSQAVQHRFVHELFAGAVPDAVMARYLIQDHRFLDSFLVLLGAALASADTFAARLRFGRFIGMVSAEENTYFLGDRGFGDSALEGAGFELPVPLTDEWPPKAISPTARYCSVSRVNSIG